MQPERIPLSLYLHFPWCVRKCPYCDFNSHPLHGDVPETDYVDALLRDLDYELQSAESRPLVSLFLGGGTPSLFSGVAISRVLEGVSKRLQLAPDVEITLEANPGTIDEANFRGYRDAGVNRLSIGVQSMNAEQLKRLGRIHDPDAVRSAVATARRAGFDNLNLDLMFALPRQTPDEAADDLRAALALEPEHLSYYQLTLEPNTEFAARPPPLPDNDDAWIMQSRGLALLADAGFARYEVSAYARTGRQARHNVNYWTFGDYLGIGAGAHGKLSNTQRIVRRARHKHPKAYMQHAGRAAMLQEDRVVPVEDLPFEFCMNALRLDEGFRWDDFAIRTGQPRSSLEPQLAHAQKRGLIELDADGARATSLGLQHLNELLTGLLP